MIKGVKIYKTTGQMIFSKRPGSIERVEIDLGTLEHGIYVLEVDYFDTYTGVTHTRSKLVVKEN